MDLIWLFISRIVVLKRKKKLFFGLWHCSMLMGMFCSIWLEWFRWLDDFFFLFCGYGLCSWRILYHFTQYFVCFILSSNSWWLFSLLLLTLVFQFCPSMVGFQIIFIYFLYTIKALLFLFFYQAQVLLGHCFVFSWTHVAQALIKNYLKSWRNVVWTLEDERVFILSLPIDLKWDFPLDKVSSNLVWRNLF